jgi:hypothetical protein
MRTALVFALCFALCCHAVYAGDLHSLLSTYLQKAGCGAAPVAEASRCIRAAFATMTGDDTCENFGRLSPCWPKCYCDSPAGFARLRAAFQPQCARVPPCGAPAGGAGDASREGSSREGSSREGSSREGSSREGWSREGSSREGSSREGSSAPGGAGRDARAGAPLGPMRTRAARMLGRGPAVDADFVLLTRTRPTAYDKALRRHASLNPAYPA